MGCYIEQVLVDLSKISLWLIVMKPMTKKTQLFSVLTRLRISAVWRRAVTSVGYEREWDCPYGYLHIMLHQVL
jgi:hypothetical protein